MSFLVKVSFKACTSGNNSMFLGCAHSSWLFDINFEEG